MNRDIAHLRKAYHSSALNYNSAAHLVTMDTDLSWISKGAGDEWLTIDLGADSELTGIAVLWGKNHAGNCEIRLSSDNINWIPAAVISGSSDAETEASLSGKARFVSLMLSGCSGECYEIRKVRIFGDNDLNYTLPAQPEAQEDGRILLTGGSWKLQRASEVPASGTEVSCPDFDDSAWLPAVVPGTVYRSYLDAGSVPDIFYDDDQFQISEEYFTADFWYRNRFVLPKENEGKRVSLNFDQINWKADIYLNGTLLENTLSGRKHSIEGSFIRGIFDVTDLVRFGEENDLAVLIFKNDTPGDVTTQGLAFGPGPNGGLLGADNPTLHAAVGWDWLPTIRGRDCGIIGDVSVSFTGKAAVVDPWMETELRLLKEETALPMEDLTEKKGVKIDGSEGTVCEWHGTEGSSFTVELSEAAPVGAVTCIWGTEAGAAAADFESRHAEAFRIERSADGVNWTPLDAYSGGSFEIRGLGMLQASAQPGTDTLEGHSISDTLPGATAVVTPAGAETKKFVRPEEARFLRFTVLRQRHLNGRAVDTIVRAFHVYEETPEQLEQGIRHSYELDTDTASLTLHTEVRNCGGADSVILRGRILPDGPVFEKEIAVKAGGQTEIALPLTLSKPKLWWPNTYGKQFLYTAEIEVLADGTVSDRKSFKFGVRRMDTPIDGGLLTLYVNGVRIVAKGGNWGIDDGLKRDTAQVLDDKVRLHAEANMTMIRNWVGMTSHPAFYDACDKYGVLIWDDFWLANPVDGPDPDDPELFLQNAADKIRMVRSHASLAFYCGRNEANPPEYLNKALDALCQEMDGTRIYFPHSAAAPVGSGGGYSLAKPGQAFGVKQYFNDVTSSVLRSERGIPNIPAIESVRKFVRPEHLWPISETWALHDWTYHMNGPANTYMEAMKMYLGGDFEVPVDNVQGQKPSDEDPVFIEYKAAVAKMCEEAGEAWNADDFFDAAQLINYDHHRGMFDALSSRLSNGLLMWMSQSSWPSFMWQTYDYYLDTNGGYFGTKAGNQPTRALFDPRNDRILLANATPEVYEDLTASAEVFDLNGKKVSEKTFSVPVLAADTYALQLGQADFSASGTDLVFLRLTLKNAQGDVLGQNLYWHNRKEYQNYLALRELPQAETDFEVLSETEENGETCFTLKLTNGSVPAMGVRIRLTDADGQDVLPVFYSDNYLMMMPEETRIVTAKFRKNLLSGAPVWIVESRNNRNSR